MKSNLKNCPRRLYKFFSNVCTILYTTRILNSLFTDKKRSFTRKYTYTLKYTLKILSKKCTLKYTIIQYINIYKYIIYTITQTTTLIVLKRRGEKKN